MGCGSRIVSEAISSDARPDLSHEIELTPAFHDLDPMDIVWHGNYVKYLEIARNALMAKFGYDYPQMRESGYLWPVVDTRVKSRHPLTFEQRIRVRARLEEFENRLRIGYEIFDAESGKRATTGYTIQVAVDEKSREMCFVCPDILFERMGVTP